MLRGQYSLTLQAAAPEGEAEVYVELVDASSGEFLARTVLDGVRVLPRARLFATTPTRPLAKEFDRKIRLLGYDLAGGQGKLTMDVPQIAPGAELIVTAHWQAMAQMSTSYTVFAQVLDGSGRLVAQHDSLPQNGKAPTTAWVEGEAVPDEHVIPIPVDLPQGDYTVITGVYDATTGKRLSVEGGGDFVALAKLHLAVPSK